MPLDSKPESGHIAPSDETNAPKSRADDILQILGRGEKSDVLGNLLVVIVKEHPDVLGQVLNLARNEQQRQGERGRREDDRLDRGQWMAFALAIAALVSGAVGGVVVALGAYLATTGSMKFAIALFLIGVALLGGATAMAQGGGLFMRARKIFSASRDSKDD